MNRISYSIFVFDFDGTLINSNNLKRDNFFEVCSRYELDRGYLNQLLSSPQNYDRYTIFERFCKYYKIDESYLNLAKEYTSLCKRKIKECSKREGPEALLSELFLSKKKVFVNSATPEKDLIDLVGLVFSYDFDGIFGRPNSKVKNLIRILDLTKTKPNEIIMIGDGIDDLEAANEIGCEFIGLKNGTLELNGEKNLISDMKNIKENYLLT
ncbi:Phosphatase [Prochlorococcus marinus str. MIT 9215]|uniref:Phosphatase n=1 Tax=Prochlorococcus marinus (strain MIT 9215) TaxID=93060 RepID=A8G647_PROM2|nr:HAD hydrolase-like protein [Prochlorococcus marinus]ABV51078.1 Phosphatase [Prochlorococcus marinus str. MIT 9215]